MSNDQQGQHQNGNVPSGLGWPITVLGLGLLASITIISATGGDVNALDNTLGKLLAAVGAAGGLGAWVNSTRAARQTNGVLDQRMKEAVHNGITTALQTAQQQQAAPPAEAPKRPRKPHGEATQRMTPPPAP